MTWSSPEFWDGLSKVGLVLVVAAFHVVAYLRGWLIPGRHHREVVDGNLRALEKADERADKDAEAIATLSGALARKDAVDDATTRLISAIRDSGRT